MKVHNFKRQRGSVLLVSLFILTVLLMLGASAMTGSMGELRVSGITKRTMDGFQKAEAGANGTFALVGTPDNPFDGTSKSDVFASISGTNPISNVDNTKVRSDIVQSGVSCVRNRNGFSANKIACDYYEVVSSHAELNTGIESTVKQGVRKEVIAY